MIKTDMDWKAKRISLQDEREHKTRLFRIWLTMLVVVAIAGMATGVILAGQPVAGSVLATVDLVALAHVLVNSRRRGDIGHVPHIAAPTPAPARAP
jgi:hypothetical protein